jgi:hypothetical protein
MKPSFHRYLLAHTAGISAGAGMLGALALLIRGLMDSDVLPSDAATVTWMVLAAVPMVAAGWVFGMAFVWRLLGPLAAKAQGWPFQVGDEIRILSGKHKNTITRIYGIWDARGEVRVELGADARNAAEDVFCAVAVCRTKTRDPSATEPTTTASPAQADLVLPQQEESR